MDFEIQEFNKIIKLLIGRDFELSQLKQKQHQQIVELKRITQILIKRDLALNQTKSLLQGALTKSDRLRLELEQEKNKTESIINSLDSGVIVINEKMNFIFTNPQAENFCKVKFEEIENKPAEDFLTHPGLGPVLRLIGKEDKDKYARKELVLNKGEEKILQITTVPLIDKTNNILGLIISLYDISREKLIERMKTEFVSITAHQLRTPLSGIKWVFIMLMEGDAGPLTAEQKDLVKKGYESNERMIILINDLLDLARLEEGRFLYKFSLFSIIDLVKDNISAFAPLTKKKKISLIFEKPKKTIPKIMGDQEKMRLVIQNLLDNAVRYTPEGGKVTISVKSDNLYIEVEIKDTGIGIPSENQPRIFDKFFRADNARKMETEGSGLGLFISKNIIEKHGGKIWFESPASPAKRGEKENKGSTFYFKIPVKDKNQ